VCVCLCVCVCVCVKRTSNECCIKEILVTFLIRFNFIVRNWITPF